MEIEDKVKFYYGIIMAMLALAIIAGGLVLIFIRYQKRMLLKQQELLKQDATHKQDLLLNSIESTESERMRVAKDIHDEIGSIFSILSVSVDQLSNGQPNETVQFVTCKNLIQSGIDSVRRISHSMVPFELELLGLQQTLENHFETVGGATNMETHFEADGLYQLNDSESMSVYRIIQELSSNCIRYAGAQNLYLQIQVNRQKGTCDIHYKDDGAGIDLAKTGMQKGIGLKNIESRVIALSGSVQFSSELGNGFSCAIIFPLNTKITA